jgi:hypothetical protein
MEFAIASASAGGTSSPDTSSSTDSGMPPVRVATTGSPVAIASCTARPSPSSSPVGRRRLGCAKRVALSQQLEDAFVAAVPNQLQLLPDAEARRLLLELGLEAPFADQGESGA